MTKEEAIGKLKGFDLIGSNEDIEFQEALDMAIEALKQQPSEDEEVIRVSKGTVKARKGRFVIYDAEWLKKHFNTTEAKLYGQPSEDCISRQDVLNLAKKGVIVSNRNYESVCKAINELPSVTPQPRKGHWIFNKTIFDKYGCTVECSSCHKKWKTYDEIRWKKENNHCPKCGTKMESEVAE